MFNLNNLHEGSIVICPNRLKQELIEIKSIYYPTKDIKFLTKEDLIEGFYFSYDINAIYYLHKTYGYDYHLAEEVINNLYNISPINDKLTKLFNIYKDLLDKDLLKVNPYFKYLFNNKQVYILGYLNIDVELLTLIKQITPNYSYIEEDLASPNNLEAIFFDDIETEVNYVMTQIGSLLEKGIALNKIYFYKAPSEYSLILKKALMNHNIILDSGSNIYLYDTPIYKEYLLLLNDHSFADAYQLLNEKTTYDLQDILGTLVNLILDVTSIKITETEQVELLNYLAAKTKVKGIEYKESIKEIDDSYYLNDDEYCFMFGFSLGTYPIIIKDTEFYLDQEKVLLNKNTSIIKNYINEINLCNFLKRNKNIIITFKEKSGKQVYYPSLLMNKLNIQKKTLELDNIRYSKKQTLFEVSKYYDLNRLYGVYNKWMETFSESELEFNTYDHTYKGITGFDQHQELTLSYTQIDDYMKCPFKYYLKHILNVDEFIGNFKTEIGILFHDILEHSNQDINLDDYKEEIFNKFETYKDRYFAEKVLPDVLKVIKKNNELHQVTLLNKIAYEQEIIIKLDQLTSLMGRIDKFLIDDITKMIAVVDYKTGKFTFDKKKVEVGLNLQLPIYALLLSSSYPEYQIAGVYIQKVLLENNNIEEKDAFLLDGITINNLKIIKSLDPTLGEVFDENGKRCPASIYIKGIKIKDDGNLYASSPVVDSDEFSCLLDITKNHILKTIDAIRHVKFDISPLDLKEEKGDACTYCKFADICNHESQDTRHVSLKERSN